MEVTDPPFCVASKLVIWRFNLENTSTTLKYLTCSGSICHRRSWSLHVPGIQWFHPAFFRNSRGAPSRWVPQSKQNAAFQMAERPTEEYLSIKQILKQLIPLDILVGKKKLRFTWGHETKTLVKCDVLQYDVIKTQQIDFICFYIIKSLTLIYFQQGARVRFWQAVQEEYNAKTVWFKIAVLTLNKDWLILLQRK